MKNKTVNIFGSKYKIKYIDKVYDDDNNWIYGKVDYSNKEILISILREDNKQVQKEEIELTFYHELIHAVLLSGQYINPSNDEPLVEWLARCMLSLKQQGIFKE